jgi:KUP system potassium uptake protein
MSTPRQGESGAEATLEKAVTRAYGSEGHGHNHGGLIALAIGAIGVVFGDIGTSPLYAFRETFASHHGAPGIQVDPVHIHGVLSLVFWSMMIVVTFKYVLTIMKADNKGEGGSLALLALINRKSENARGPGRSCCWACSRPRCSMAIR